ncbi:MAG: hypothetical protein EBT39_04370, partial [Sphingobacteriia bacterium]|nr:hypothetical protein [Candidatus Fonsibacter lacus]
FKKGEVIGLAHVDDQPASEIGRNHNHNEKNPTANNIKNGNKRYLIASKNLKPGEEITTNYRLQPELEQPEDFMRKGGSVLRLPNKKNSKGYSRSLSATNKLFTQNFLFEKPKSRKNKVFDPNSKYYAEGGALLTKKVTCKKCGREWDAEDGGKDITTCHKCGGQGLVHAQDGGNKDAMTGMMKARLAYANEFGNPAAERMINLPDNPYQFDNGDIGSHYMASMDNYAVPQIQDENGVLQLGDYGPESNEAIRFDSDEDANYFAENYKDVSPGFLNQKQYGGNTKTKLSDEEEKTFQKFYNTLPDNLQSDDDTYDIRGYWDSEGRPEKFNYDQPKEKNGYYHAYSINGNTGEYLKSPAHETFQHAVDEDRKIGYRPIPNIYGRNIATYNESLIEPEEPSFLRNTAGPVNYIEADLDEDEIEEYRRGGYIVEEVNDPSIATLNRLQSGGVSYELGDEVDEDTMKRLKAQGYTFEIIK